MTPGTNELEGKLLNRHVGFTGTREGMTSEQIEGVDNLLMDDLITSCAHSGDCIGADEMFHKLAKLNGLTSHGHPPLDPSKRAFCQFDSMEEEKDYHERNHDIVDSSDWLIACPKGYKEELRSGTWMTIRYAREKGRTGNIVWPDGRITDLYSDYNGETVK